MLIHFPAMHAELADAGDVDGAVFFDPGLADDETDRFRPENLPLDTRTARALVRDSVSFGEQFKNPSEMAFFGAHTPEDYFSESESTIKSQLLVSIGAMAPRGGRVDADAPLRRAQFILLLAWATEERLVETSELEKGVMDSWQRMSGELGIDEDDERTGELGRILSNTAPSSPAGQRLAWQRVMEGMAAFMPKDAVLLCSDSEIIETWREAGLNFTSADRDELPSEAEVVTAPAWKLAGRSRAPEELPFTERGITVACISK